MSWFAQLPLNPAVSGASCSAVASWSWWPGWKLTQHEAEQGGPSPLYRHMVPALAHIPASSAWARCIRHPTPHAATCPRQGDVEKKVLMSLPTINLSAWGVLKPEPLPPPPALTHVNKRFLKPIKGSSSPSSPGPGPRVLGKALHKCVFCIFRLLAGE